MFLMILNKIKIRLPTIFFFFRYLVLTRNFFARPCLIQLLTSVISMILCLFLFVLKRWIIGPFLFAANYTQLLACCLIGTLVDLQNAKILETTYNTIWYKLPYREQKKILLMLMRSQSLPSLKIGHFADLNVATCLQTTKAIYTYFMMIVEYLAD